MPNANRGAVGFQSSEFEQQYDRPSKSQLKRESTALQKLGETLVNAARDRVKRIAMPEDVKEAILICQQISDHEGRRRQLQYVGKKMRTLTEEEVNVIQTAVDGWRGTSRAEAAALHAVERQRDRLLADDNVITELRARHPELDVQHLRTLVRNARKEQAEKKPPKAYREIFQLLKSLQDGSPSSTEPEPEQRDDEENPQSSR
jgi:ribosome-associated protein